MTLLIIGYKDNPPPPSPDKNHPDKNHMDKQKPDIIPLGQTPPPPAEENHPVIIFHVIVDDLHGIQSIQYISVIIMYIL